ncbi:MAG TPA: DUF4157 domain-containing protein [Longimicrobium sp.]|nr:DUF4157 domain-containing protein [Longimicrobium sp.]
MIRIAHSPVPRPSTHTPAPVLRRCGCGGQAPAGGECAECKRKGLQRSASAPAPAAAPAIVHDVLRAPGAPLDAGVRAAMEPRFGHSFADVRVHADGRAAESAAAVGAHAYAVGRDVVFGAGRYAPSSRDGRRLIAHELAHVVQQSGAGTAMQASLEVGRSDAPEERAADAAADAVMRGDTAPALGAAPLAVSREDGDGGTPVPTPAPAADGGVPDAGTQDAGATATAPATCAPNKTGTLSKVSWGETSGLYPGATDKYSPDKWDTARLCELMKMRAGVHAVGDRGQSVHRSSPREGDKIEQMLKRYHLVENFPALDAEVADAGVKWFYLSSKADGPAVHPGTTGTIRVKGYGPFHNVGGGDVKAGDTWVHFYKLP